MSDPLLGWISPRDRTNAQHDAHARALLAMPRFGLRGAIPPKGTKIILTKLWADPSVVADVGFEFNGFRQLTGSCVGVSEGNAVFTLSCVQRKFAENPTKAFVPWWPFPYGRTRYNEGDRGQGEGAIDSVMGETLKSEGVFDAGQSGLPTFNTSDGLALTSSQELQWSDGARIDQKWRDLAKQYPVGGVAPLYDPDNIRDSLVNGYPVLYGCDYYVGHGSIVGSGDLAYVRGKYDGRGGHSTCFLGYWNHPNDGELFLYSNQWDGSTYPKDPAGGGRCTVWVPRSEVQLVFSRYGGGNGETMALSHLTWFPAQPDVIETDWGMA